MDSFQSIFFSSRKFATAGLARAGLAPPTLKRKQSSEESSEIQSRAMAWTNRFSTWNRAEALVRYCPMSDGQLIASFAEIQFA